MNNDEYLYLWAQWGVLSLKQYRLVLKEYGNLKNAWKKVTPSFMRAIGAGRQEKSGRIFEIRERISFYDLVRTMDELGINVFCIDDDDYPFYLKQVTDAPPFIFVRGSLPSFHKSLAVVGTRNITDYGKAVTEKFVKDLVYNGFVIVSGLAFGVDAKAHRVTVDCGGVAVAVLGSGVDQIYPSSNYYLAKAILDSGGAIVSEYPLGTHPAKHHFPERNRIISGLSRGTLVVEGGAKSGALITADFALNQGRDIFAVPNNITKTSLSGTNKLIRTSGAKLVEKTEHILEDFAMQKAEEQKTFDFNPDERKILELLSGGGMTMDDLAAGTFQPVSQLSVTLTGLHLKGAVREEGSRWVVT